MYKLITGGVQRIADGAFLPQDERNVDWREYQVWLDLGGTPQNAEPTVLTPLEQIRALEAQYADDQAKITRQTLLLTVVGGALASPAGATVTAGMDPETAKATIVATLLATDKSFKLMYELEQNISILRAQIP